MLIIVRTILIQLALGFRSRVTLQAENAVLHHQVEILRRRAPRRVHVTRTDRLFFKLILRLWPKAAGLIRIVHPKTLVRWHREGFRLYWRWRSRKRGGRPKIPKEIRVLVRQMSTENPLWGAPRIHGELLKLGFDISQATVSRHMPKRRPNPDQTWKTFLLNHPPLHVLDRFLGRSDADLSNPLYTRHSQSRSPRAGPFRSYYKSDR